ncbi:uncharacterized protein LOC113351741 [Papaver somniferum]|uniref:uncharacterized protein LOC113351741 n=1 Tax=Papaver somniferum TaxID=3469 RepID=UPI000E705A7E|nr:uncharacterized protein LOC113351741 [Papaver somniferum]
MDACYHLRNTIQRFIDEGKFAEYVQIQPANTEIAPKKRVELPQDGKYINMITFSYGEQEDLFEDSLDLVRNRKNMETHEVFKLSGPPTTTWDEWMATPLTFSTKYVNHEVEMHNDPLVITLPIHGWNVTKVLIDGGSSLNVLFYEPYLHMGLTAEQMDSSTCTIYGFNGAASRPIEEIVLQVRAGPLVTNTRFCVVDAPSPYNVIMGRLWVHRLRGITSTYHHYLRFPTPMGEMEIKGDQQDARLCNLAEVRLDIEKDVAQQNGRKRRKANNKEITDGAFLVREASSVPETSTSATRIFLMGAFLDGGMGDK